MLAIVEDLGQGDENADDDADDNERQRSGESRDVDTARLVNVQRRLDVR